MSESANAPARSDCFIFFASRACMMAFESSTSTVACAKCSVSSSSFFADIPAPPAAAPLLVPASNFFSVPAPAPPRAPPPPPPRVLLRTTGSCAQQRKGSERLRDGTNRQSSSLERSNVSTSRKASRQHQARVTAAVKRARTCEPGLMVLHASTAGAQLVMRDVCIKHTQDFTHPISVAHLGTKLLR